jgi:hypothetical protein
MKLEFGFGTTVQTVDVPDENVIGVLHANQVEHELMGEEEVRRALSHPIGAPLLKDVVKPGEKIAIVTSDITRPMPTYVVMPPLLDALYEAGVKKGRHHFSVCFGKPQEAYPGRNEETGRRTGLRGDYLYGRGCLGLCTYGNHFPRNSGGCGPCCCRGGQKNLPGQY